MASTRVKITQQLGRLHVSDEKAQQISNREQRRKIMLVKAKRSSMSSRNIQNPLIKRQRERDEQRQRNIELVEMQTDKNLFVGVETTHSEVLKRPPTHHACCSRAKFALANVLVFWLATAIVLLVYFGALQQAWWTAPPIRCLFFVGQMCACAELALTLASPEHKIDWRFAAPITTLFALCCILFAAAPDVAFGGGSNAIEVAYESGNCTDLNKISAADQELMQKACPSFNFTEAFVKPSDYLRKNEITDRALIGKIVVAIERLKDNTPLIRHFRKWKDMKKELSISDDVLNLVWNLNAVPSLLHFSVKLRSIAVHMLIVPIHKEFIAANQGEMRAKNLVSI